MPHLKPNVREIPNRKNAWETRIRYGAGRRQRFVMVHCRNESAALERAESMSELAEMLVAAGKIDDVVPVLERAATAENTARFVVVRNLVRRVCSGEYEISSKVTSKVSPDLTIREFGSMWTDGELHRRWPDHVVAKITASDDLWRLRKYVYPVIGDLQIRNLKLDDAESVMSGLGGELSAATRRHIAQLLVRLCHLAVYPARLRADSPIPRGWLPKVRKRLAYPIMYPSEDLALLSTTKIPIWRRLVYGFLHREGVRRGDAERLCWRQLDLTRGTIRLEIDKTEHPRFWRLDPGVYQALLRWKELKGEVTPDAYVFANDAGKVPNLDHLAEQLRDDMRAAGIDRAELFESRGNWGRFNVHTLRHSFVTRMLANGASEDEVRRRTGHKSNELLRYRENAQSAAELNIGELTPMHEAIPELARLGQRLGHSLGQVEKRASLEAAVNTKNNNLIN